MSGSSRIKRLLFVATAAVVPALVVAACAIQLRGHDDSTLAASSVTPVTDPVAAELERCRTVTSEQVAELQECRRVWAEHRRRFLGQKKAPAVPSIDRQPSTPPAVSARSKAIPERVFPDTPPAERPKGE
jgi:conjugative transfer region protein TrbK